MSKIILTLSSLKGIFDKFEVNYLNDDTEILLVEDTKNKVSFNIRKNSGGINDYFELKVRNLLFHYYYVKDSNLEDPKVKLELIYNESDCIHSMEFDLLATKLTKDDFYEKVFESMRYLTNIAENLV